jgi:YVTN family beta-propeller protein
MLPTPVSRAAQCLAVLALAAMTALGSQATAVAAGPIAVVATHALSGLGPGGGLATVAFATPSVGWAGGPGTILATTNGGRTWQRQWQGAEGVTALEALSSTTAVALTTGSVLVTTDGGAHWRAVATPHGGANCPPAAANCLAAIDFATATVGYGIAALPASLGTDATGTALSPDGKTLYVANESGTVTAFNLARGQVAWSLAVGAAPTAVAVSPDGQTLYVANQNDGTLAVVSTASHRLVARVPVSANPCALAVAPDGRTVYVSGSNGVSVVDAQTSRVTASIEGAGGGCGLALSAATDRLYSSTGGAAAVVDTLTNHVVAHFAAADGSWGLAVSADGALLYAALPTGNQVAVMNAETGAVLHAWDTPDLVQAVALNAAKGQLIVAGGGTASALDLSTGRLLWKVTNQAISFGVVAIAPDGKEAYVPADASVLALSLGGTRPHPTSLAASGVSDDTAFGPAVPEGPAQLVVTRDGGQSWQVLGTPGPVQSVCFATASQGYVADGADLYRTDDGGRTWRLAYRAPLQSNEGAETARGCSGDRVLMEVGGQGAALGHAPYIAFLSTDGGARFQPTIEENYTHPGKAGVNAPEGPGSYPGPFTLTPSGTPVYSGTTPAAGTTAVLVGSPAPGRAHDVLGVSGIAWLSFPSATTGYAVTTDLGAGRLVKTTDGGRSWAQVLPVVPYPLYAVTMVGPKVAFGLGTAGDPTAVVRTDDAGTSWTTVGQLPALPSPYGGASLAFANRSDGVAVSMSGALYRTANGGRSWRQVAGRTASSVALDGDAGCAFTSSTVLVTRNGGRTWGADSALSLPQGASPEGCAALVAAPTWRAAVSAFSLGGAFEAALGGQDAWATLNTGLYRTQDGGSTWTLYQSPALANTYLVALSFGTPQIGLALTQGSLFRTTDGGQVWRPLA